MHRILGLSYNFCTFVLPEDSTSGSSLKNVADKGLTSGVSPDKKRVQTTQHSALTWTEKYKPKVPNDIIGNQSLVWINYYIPP